MNDFDMLVKILDYARQEMGRRADNIDGEYILNVDADIRDGTVVLTTNKGQRWYALTKQPNIFRRPG